MEKASGASKFLLGAVTGAVAGAVALGGKAVMQLAEIERISAQTDAVIKSTGGVANVTADEIANMAVEMQYMTSVEHEAIRQGANLLLTFTNIRNEVGKGNDIFNRTTGIMTDMSVALGTDTTSAATMLGKALNDPIQGVTALQRVGVSFTDQQKNQIKALQESGDILGAQKLILNELEVQYGGSAEALGGTFTGALTMAKMAFDDIGQAIMSQLNTLDWLKDKLDMTTTAFRNIASSIESNGLKGALLEVFPPETHSKIAMIAGAITVGLIPSLYGIGKAIVIATASIAPFLIAGAAIGALAYMIYDNWAYFEPFFTTAFNIVGTAVQGFKDVFMSRFQNLLSGITPLWESVKTLLKSLEPIVMAVVTILGVMLVTGMAVCNGVVNAIAPLMTAFFNLLDVVANVVMSVVSLLTGDWQGAVDYWNKATQSSIEFFKNIWNSIVSFFNGFVGTFISILSSFGVDVVGKFSEMWNNAQKKTSEGVAKVTKFFSEMPGKVMTYITSLGSDLVSGFTSMMSKGATAVSDGVSNIVSTVTGFASTFLSAGKGLLESFTEGVTSGIGKAVSAVSNGMQKIRQFLPFSPAKKGPLSDLDKSGESFFPTWYEGALKQVRPMERVIGRAMGSLNEELAGDSRGIQLDGFGGTSRQTLTVRVEGAVNVKGDTGKEQVKVVAQETREQFTDNNFLDGLRQAFRKM